MAGIAAHRHDRRAAVVDVGIHEQLGAVAVTAIGNCRQMSIVFANTDHVVMAGTATVLVEIGRCVAESTG